MKMVHIITGLGDGGAEAMLFKLVENTSGFNITVISLMDEGKYGSKIKNLDIRLHTLGLNRNSFSFLSIFKLYKILKNEKPDVVQTWMYHSNILGGLIAWLLGIKKIYWNIRGENIRLNNISIKNKIVFYLSIFFSHFIPRKIITCSKKAITFHLSKGYKDNFYYIPNGFNKKDFFTIDNNKILTQRKQWNKNLPKFILGVVARHHPQKNHELIFKAIHKLKKNKFYNDIFFIFSGENINYQNTELTKIINELKIGNKLILLNKNTEMNIIYNSIDVLILASGYGEGFPNVIGESMLCGTPCIVSNSGESHEIVGSNGWLIKNNDVDDLVEKICESYSTRFETKKWQDLSTKCINYINNNFDIKKIVKLYEEIWSR